MVGNNGYMVRDRNLSFRESGTTVQDEGKEWSKIKEHICDVMENGTEYPSGSASCKVMNIRGYDVEVRFKRLADGTVRISDAFVR